MSKKRPGQKGFVRQLARSLAHRTVRSRATGRRRKIKDPLAYAATVERRRLAKRKRPNPALAIFGNPGRRLIARHARLVEYTDPSKGPDLWFHKFKEHGVRILGEPDGSVRLAHPRRRLWAPDGKGRAWLENPGGAQGERMARRKRKHRRHSRGPGGRFTARRHTRRVASMHRKRSRNDPGRRRRGRRRSNPFARHHRRRRSNPGRGVMAFLGQLPEAAMGGLAVTAGKAGARYVPKLVGFTPTGIMGLVVQTLAGTVVAAGVNFVAPKFAFNMLLGTFENLYESLARTPVAGAPIPIIGTALSDHHELYRLAGYAAPRAVGAYARPIVARSQGAGMVQGRMMGKTPRSGRLVYVAH